MPVRDVNRVITGLHNRVGVTNLSVGDNAGYLPCVAGFDRNGGIHVADDVGHNLCIRFSPLYPLLIRKVIYQAPVGKRASTKRNNDTRQQELRYFASD